MIKTLLAIVPVLAVLVLAPVARAEDVFDPPWGDVDPSRVTWQDWEFYVEAKVDVEPDDYENPYGTPLLTMDPVDSWEGWGVAGNPSWDGTLTSWHVGGDDPAKHSIQIHNNPDPDGVRKEVWVQVTSTGAPISVGGQPGHGATTTPGGDPFLLGTDATGATWSVYPYLVTFPGNPSMEYIEIWFEPCTWIEEIIIHTRCVPVPEPSLMAILGLAGLLFLRKRKK
jgi:hypothetical protein